MKVEYVFRARVLDVSMYPDYRDGTTDGDTMRFDVDLGFRVHAGFNFRVKNFDAPEKFSPRNEAEKTHALEAEKYAENLLIGKQVIIQTYKDPAAWNRYEAVITLPDGTDFAQVMTAAGMTKRETY